MYLATIHLTRTYHVIRTPPESSPLCKTRSSPRLYDKTSLATSSLPTAFGQRSTSAIAASAKMSSLSFGTRSSFVALLDTAADVSSHGEDGAMRNHVLVPDVFPGGYGIILFNTIVESELRDAIGELGRGRENFLFSSTLPDTVPAEETAIIFWRLNSVVVAVEASDEKLPA